MSSEDVLISPIPCPESWRLVKLKELTRKIGSGATPKGGQAAYLNARINFALVRSQNVFDREFSETGLAFISDTQAEALKVVWLEDDDILLNITGDGVTFGRACLVPAKVLPACVNQHVSIIRLDKSIASPGYIASYLTHPTIKSYIESFNAGGSRRAITKAHIESFVIPLPPIEIQNEIAHVLGAFDNRIALLRETNATLEAIAQALFKSWFVDFDPVHANAGTQAPSLPAEIQSLFPSRLVESPQGLIPEGWEVCTIADVIETLGGATPNTKNDEFWNPPEVSWTSPKDLSGLNSPVFLETERKISKLGLSKISSGLLPIGTLLMSSRAPIGYLAMAQVPLAINQGYIAMPPGGKLTPLFMLYWCRQNMELIENRANGSTFMEISKKAFRPIEIVLPPNIVVDAFMSTAETLFDRLVENEKQIRSLSDLRDTLLPRLISGQLRLPDVDAELQQVAS